MQRNENRDAGMGEIAIEIQSMHVHNIDGISLERPRDRNKMPGSGRIKGRLIKAIFRGCDIEKFPSHLGRPIGHDQRVDTSPHEAGFQCGQHLLGTGTGSVADGSERISDAQDG
jgi:hypothetical protein